MRQFISAWIRRLLPQETWSELNNQYDSVLENIARNVRQLRKDRGMSQFDLAIASEIDRTYLGYVENAKHNVSTKILCQLAKALEVDLEELVRESIQN